MHVNLPMLEGLMKSACFGDVLEVLVPHKFRLIFMEIS